MMDTLKERIQRMAVTYRVLADATGYSPTTVSQVVNDRQGFYGNRAQVRAKIARVLDEIESNNTPR